MGSKVHPKSFRLSTIRSWDSIWFAKKEEFSNRLRDDERIRTFLFARLKEANVDRILIERSLQNVSVTIYSAKPGFIIGRAGVGIEELKKAMMKKLFPGRRIVINLNVKEISQPSLSAAIIGQQIATDIERRLPFRRSMKSAIDRVMKAGAEGVKISLSGRLNGAEIARREKLAQGKVPLHNLRADIDYARVTAHTIYGSIGVTVWINRGEIFTEKVEETAS
ncbi:TPA: 30S ribosomal protein S3 [Candidatus Uhrbacteria bacterium]|uniref:Small ribosomal subunit protein uS3 n=1 Tax=Candidatus Uhrbacteria bacterium GW2011_GWC2_53_7 TaxID=1618986 RepID=A0A0G1Y1N0_9BACT|nr:MAG: 30S ribosomal protein S3 [Parcubacteria group bacterium GW2011_GWA2_53_21]KKW37106.1 MAG: 30S ribosomal protein S3 [Candidatus Uhrbacteria bacterium GW2011_GWC2_53_7]OGL72192.1 MAG: 30S ribosomal protein S3 [Candidatus Uhrbacteria bacterium RIFCSPHIGHO2_02_FULL_54_11]HBL39426.1 30S ribosomal protein S3 [Candidatus Uhrbacteria bacterium]